MSRHGDECGVSCKQMLRSECKLARGVQYNGIDREVLSQGKEGQSTARKVLDKAGDGEDEMKRRSVPKGA